MNSLSSLPIGVQQLAIVLSITLSFSLCHPVSGSDLIRECIYKFASLSPPKEEPLVEVNDVYVEADGENPLHLQVPTQEYKQEKSRSTGEYKHFLGHLFPFQAHFRNKISPFSKWKNSLPTLYVDSGSGLGVAPIDIALRYQIPTVAITGHNFWSFVRMLAETRPEDLVDHSKENSLNIEMLLGLGRSLGIKAGSSEPSSFWTPKRLRLEKRGVTINAEVEAKRIRDFARKILAKRAEMEKEGLFTQVVGDAEKGLAHYKGKVDVLSDVFGTYFYSRDKLKIIQTYYDALAKGGQAFVVRRGSSSFHGHDTYPTVSGGTFENVELWEFLKMRYPRVFKHTTAHVIVIERIAGVEKLDFGTRLDDSLEGTDQHSQNKPRAIRYWVD